MSAWKWDLREALSIVKSTYSQDWGGYQKLHGDLLNDPSIKFFKNEEITGYVSGEGQPVVFIHGSPANALRWSEYLKNAPKGYSFISIDRMGFGQRRDRQANLEDDYKLIKEFISKHKSSIIVGHSLGGAISLRLATELNVKGLLLIAASLDPDLEKQAFLQEIIRLKPFSWLLSRSVRSSNEEMFQLTSFMRKTEKALSNFQVPTELIHPLDDRLVSAENIFYAEKHIKNLNVVSPETGGHSIPWTQQDLIMNSIQELAA